MGRRARDRDRDAAVEMVERACSEGRIVAADRDVRVAQLRAARTTGDIQLLVRDLQPHQPAPRPAPRPASRPAYPPPTAPGVMDGPAHPVAQRSGPTSSPGPHPGQVPRARVPFPAPSRYLGLFVLLPIVAVFLVATAVGAVIFLGVLGASEQQEARSGAAVAPTDDGGGAVRTPVAEVHSLRGFAELVAALEEETGSTRVFDAVLYPGYAVLSVPADGARREARSYYWDGSLRGQDHRSTAVHRAFDLASVDARVVLRSMRRAARLGPGLQPGYALLRADATGFTIAGYATADTGRSSHVTMAPDGTVVAEYPPSAP